jgi:hypothetical protein
MAVIKTIKNTQPEKLSFYSYSLCIITPSPKGNHFYLCLVSLFIVSFESYIIHCHLPKLPFNQ